MSCFVIVDNIRYDCGTQGGGGGSATEHPALMGRSNWDTYLFCGGFWLGNGTMCSRCSKWSRSAPIDPNRFGLSLKSSRSVPSHDTRKAEPSADRDFAKYGRAVRKSIRCIRQPYVVLGCATAVTAKTTTVTSRRPPPQVPNECKWEGLKK